MNETMPKESEATEKSSAIFFRTDLIRNFRDEIISGLILWFAVLGLFSTAAGVLKAYFVGKWGIIALYLGIYFVTLMLAIFRKRLSFRLKTLFGYAVSYVIIVVVLVYFGLGGAGIWFLLAFCVVVTGLHGFRYGLFAVGLGVVTIAVIGTGCVYEFWPMHEKVWFDSRSGYSWILGGALFTVLSSAMVICPGMLLKQLISFLTELQTKSSELQKKSTELTNANQDLKHEVAERREAQEELTEIKGHLQELVEQRTQELSETNLQLVHEISERKNAERQREAMEVHLRQQQKLESLGTLASGVAHEINNPINVIMNYATLVSDRSDRDPDSIREFADEIFKEGERVAAIVRNLLTFARKNSDSHELCSLHSLIEDTLSLIQSSLKKERIDLRVEIDPKLYWLSCNRQQLQQVFMNLITNATDALHAKEALSEDRRRIDIRCDPITFQEHKRVRISVMDNGPGMDETTLDRVFDPFFTTKTGGKGTGLGLSISHGIIKDHGGSLMAESVVGEGATFIIDLPLAENPTI